MVMQASITRTILPLENLPLAIRRTKGTDTKLDKIYCLREDTNCDEFDQDRISVDLISGPYV
jgi:hypothetical protein